MFTRDLIQAINDWQIGGDKKQKAKRGSILKHEASKLPIKYRSCELCCFRQLALPKNSLWYLADKLVLPETISSWTLSPKVASTFKGGVPPSGQQGVIFAIKPKHESVIANLERLYRNKEFRRAIKDHKDFIKGFSDGIGRYGDSEAEVVLEISSINIKEIYALGGYSSSREELIQRIYGPNATKQDAAQFDALVAKSRAKLGPDWVLDDAKDRVIAKISKIMPALRKIKKLQALIETAT